MVGLFLFLFDPEGSKGGSWRGAGGTPQPPWLFRRKAIPTVKKEFSGGIEQDGAMRKKAPGGRFFSLRVDPHRLHQTTKDRP